MRGGMRARLAGLVAGLALWASPATAGPENDGPLLGITIADFDSFQREEHSVEARVEYRHDKGLWVFKPFGGFMVNLERAGHVYAGVVADFFVTDNFVISPSFAPGIYMQGASKDLGYLLEFRSQLEFAWRFDSGMRIATSINHISNAGLGTKNPGVESLALSLVFPLNPRH
ncbi:MAG: acyloxyacyl hydrolase [Pseudomonadota bacterium]|nr:acyloxyacyl hydrolase [Pseudomonadota bacterium]